MAPVEKDQGGGEHLYGLCARRQRQEHQETEANLGCMRPCFKNKWMDGCEGDLAATSVTPLIARVDSADLAG